MCDDDKTIWTVYVHKFPNGKNYVGVTSTKPEQRWGINGKNYNNQGYISNAIKKYGWENIEHLIVLQTAMQEEAFEYEKKLIQQLKSNDRNFGYNISSGGEAGAKGVLWSEERKKAYSKKYGGEHHPMFGKHHTEITKQKMSEIAKHREPPSEEKKEKIREGLRKNRGVSVTCYETKRVYRSIAEAAEDVGVHSSNISIAIKLFPNRAAGGFHWYKTGLDVSNVELPLNEKAPKPIICIETNVLYQSLRSAAIALGIDIRHISRACRETNRIAGGYHWRYADVPNTI